MGVHSIPGSIIIGQWDVEQRIAIVVYHTQLVKEDTCMSRSELLDAWNTAAASGCKTLLKELPVKLSLVCQFSMLV